MSALYTLMKRAIKKDDWFDITAEAKLEYDRYIKVEKLLRAWMEDYRFPMLTEEYAELVKVLQEREV